MHRFFRLAGLVGAGFLCGFAVEAAPDPSGTWTYEAPVQNRTVECTLDLQFEDGQLTGTVNNRLGKVEIEDAVFDDGRITFTVTREFRRRKITTKYDGRLEHDAITGTIVVVDRKKKERSVEWHATRAE